MSDAHTDSLLSIWFDNDFVTMAFDKLHFQEWDCMEENQSVTSRQSLFLFRVYICSQFY